MAKYDYGDYAGQQFDKEPAKDFDGEVIGSCFQQDVPNTKVFPLLAKATFRKCNLNNCEIPAGCTVDVSSPNHQHREQNDGEQWILDGNGDPMAPMAPESFDAHGLSKLPEDIPAAKVSKRIVEVAEAKASATVEIARKEDEIAKLKADHGIEALEVV